MSHHDDPIAPAVETAHAWLRAVADQLGTDDRTFTHRVLRAWLHTVRDRLDVEVAAHFGAQLPELLRGVYYGGWIPAHVPVRHDTGTFIEQFAAESGVSSDEAVALIGAVTTALAAMFSPGHLDHVLAVVPGPLRAILLGSRLGSTASHAGTLGIR
ncbi:hypothetical protein NONO_c35350 [Nocardia nova SH22a]|uniref:DUF2267 domain-containing protein n=1 Tax=Nocardia nova SH22a TaxID=1415166 RepID=W5TGH9_9NOCA|nr:DUF2267 domain-containing protein [Nocardia nova]AHH18322.1 hypothetical protein NONO_c35350 [Nocardia nova SH22a]